METLFNQVVLVITACLQGSILWLLIRRRIAKRFSWFLTYIVYELCESAVRLSVAGNKSLYYNVYWLTAIGGVTFMALAVRESFLNVFRAYTRLRWFIWVVWGCIGLALVYAFIKAWVFPPIPGTRRGAIIIGVGLAVDYTIVAVGILYFFLKSFFKIKEYPRESGILGGFVVVAGAEILGLVTTSMFGARFRTVTRWLPAVAYLMAELEWLLVLRLPEGGTGKSMPDLAVDDVGKLDEYIEALARFLGRR